MKKYLILFLVILMSVFYTKSDDRVAQTRHTERERRDYDRYRIHREVSTRMRRELDSVFNCPEIFLMRHRFHYNKETFVHQQKVDSILKWQLDSVHSLYGKAYITIKQHSFRQKMKMLYGFPDNIRDIDSVTAVKIAATAATLCNGSEMIPFKAMLMGDNNEHWMVYVFLAIPDDVELQKRCYRARIVQYESGLSFYDGPRPTCPAVISVLISRKNGQVLSFMAL